MFRPQRALLSRKRMAFADSRARILKKRMKIYEIMKLLLVNTFMIFDVRVGQLDVFVADSTVRRFREIPTQSQFLAFTQVKHTRDQHRWKE